MNDDEFNALAREAGGRLESFASNPPKPLAWHFTPGALRRFVALVSQDCANVAEQTFEGSCGYDGEGNGGQEFTGENSAAAIRERFKFEGQ